LYKTSVTAGNLVYISDTLSNIFNYISTNAVTGDSYFVVLTKDDTLVPTSLSYSGKTVGITLKGYENERTVQIASTGSLFTVGSGIYLDA